MHLVAMTLLFAVASVLSSPIRKFSLSIRNSQIVSAGKRQPLDPDQIMTDVYSNGRGFMDFDFKISPDLYDDVMEQFQRFDRDYPDLPENEEPTEPVKILPKKEDPQPPVYPKVKTRFFRMFG